MKLADYIINGDYLNVSPVRPKVVGNFESGWMQICILSKEASEKFRKYTDDNQGQK